MRKILIFALSAILFSSCIGGGTIKTTLSTGINLTEYKYCVLGTNGTDGDGELTDIILRVENMLSEVLNVVSRDEAVGLISKGNKVLTPAISVKSEKWEGGHTFITISFSDLRTGRLIAVIKASGIGFSIEEDQEIALYKISKGLINSFSRKDESKRR